MSGEDRAGGRSHVGRKALTCPLTGTPVTCESCIEALYAYEEGEADARLRAVMDEHFADCPSCAVVKRNYERVIGLARAIGKENGGTDATAPAPG